MLTCGFAACVSCDTQWLPHWVPVARLGLLLIMSCGILCWMCPSVLLLGERSVSSCLMRLRLHSVGTSLDAEFGAGRFGFGSQNFQD